MRADRDALASILAVVGLALGLAGVVLWLPLGWVGLVACVIACGVAP